MALRILLQRLTKCVLGDLQLPVLQRHTTQRLRYRPRIGGRLCVWATGLRHVKATILMERIGKKVSSDRENRLDPVVPLGSVQRERRP